MQARLVNSQKWRNCRPGGPLSVLILYKQRFQRREAWRTATAVVQRAIGVICTCSGVMGTRVLDNVKDRPVLRKGSAIIVND